MNTPTGLELSIVIPAFNEAARLPATLRKLQDHLAARPWRYEIIVVDDGSATAALAEARADIELHVISLGQNLGKGAAVRRGVSAAQGEFIAILDADMSYAIADFEIALIALRNGADLVIGGRDLPGSRMAVRPGFIRRVSGKIYALLVNSLAVRRIPDTQCGFKWFRAGIAKRIFMQVTLDRFAFDVEILAIAQRWKLRIDRIPVTLTHSHDSKVRLVRDSLNMFTDLLRVNRRRARGLYDPPAEGGEAQPCPACGASSPEFERGLEGWLVARCAACSLLYLWNRLPEGQLGDFYSNRYYQQGGLHGGYADYEAQKPDLLATASDRIAILKKFAPTGRLLEVGCSYGYFLEAAAKHYPQPWGIDLSTAAIAVAQARGLQAHAGELAALPESAGLFEVLYAADLFEHLYQPHEFLKQAFARLRPGGILALVTPNEAGWLRRVSGRRWVSFKLPEHVAFYTPEYLTKMTQAAGFTPLHCRTVGQRVSVNFLLPRLKALSPVAGAVGALGLLPWRLTGTSLTAPTGNMIFIARKPSA